MRKEIGARVFFGGTPTEPDVRALREHFGVPEEGRIMTYEEVERVVGSPRESCRFKTVTDAWRRLIYQEHNRIVGVARGEGFYVLTPSERVDHGRAKIVQGGRKIRIGLDRLVTTDRERLTAEEVKALDHNVFIAGQVQQAVVAAMRRSKGPSLPSSVEDKK